MTGSAVPGQLAGASLAALGQAGCNGVPYVGCPAHSLSEPTPQLQTAPGCRGRTSWHHADARVLCKAHTWTQTAHKFMQFLAAMPNQTQTAHSPVPAFGRLANVWQVPSPSQLNRCNHSAPTSSCTKSRVTR